MIKVGLKKLLPVFLSIVIVFAMIPHSNALATDDPVIEDYNNIQNYKDKYINSTKPVVKKFDTDPINVKDADKQIADPAPKNIYTKKYKYTAFHEEANRATSQPYTVTVGEEDTNPAINKTIKMPVIPGYVPPLESFSFTHKQIVDDAKNAPNHESVKEFFYTSPTRNVKIIHKFQSLTDKDNFDRIKPKHTVQSGKIGSKLIAKALPEDQREGFEPEKNKIEVLVSDNNDKTELEKRYLRKSINVYYDTQGGSSIPARRLYYGQTLPSVKDPTKKGAMFVGWKINHTLKEISEDNELGKTLYNEGEVTKQSEFKQATPAKDVVFTAQWKEVPKTKYTVSFWSEKSDYDPSKVTSPRDKYDYIGVKVIHDADTGSTPDLNTINEDGINFPDISKQQVDDKNEFSKYYFRNKDMTQKANFDKDALGNATNVEKKVLSTGETNYNVYYDRQVYELIFERKNAGSNPFDPIIEKNGVKYDSKVNPYTVKARFNQSLVGLWPMDNEITNWPDGEASLGWILNVTDKKIIYRDTPHYRLSADEFINAPSPYVRSNTSISRPNVHLNSKQISLGIDSGSQGNTLPIHVDFFLQTFDEDEYEINPLMYYIKHDTVLSGYQFDPPKLEGFTSVEPKYSLKTIEESDAEDINDEREEETEEDGKERGKIQFVSEENDYTYNQNGWLKLEYNRKKYKLYLNNDPSNIIANADFKESKEVYYDRPLKDLNLDKTDVPKKPDSVPNDYVFLGWSLDTAGENLVKNGKETMPSHDVILYAKWGEPKYKWNITYDLNGGTVPVGLKGSNIVNCTKKDDGCSVPTPDPNNNKGEGKQIFTVNHRTKIISPILRKGDINKPIPIPVRRGYDFAGWEHVRMDKSGKQDMTYRNKYDVPELYAFENPVVESAYLRAIWVKNNFVKTESVHYFYDDDGKEIKSLRKTITFYRNRVGIYISDYAKFQDDKWVLKTDEGFLDSLKKEGKDNHYYKTIKIKNFNKGEANPNKFEFYYRKFRDRKYDVDYVTKSSNSGQATESKIIPTEHVVNENKDYDARNYRSIPGYKLTGPSQQNLTFNLDNNGVFLGINDTGKKSIKFEYEDIRVIKRKSDKSATPTGYHRIVFKTDNNGDFKGNGKEIVYDVIDGLDFKNVPVPEDSEIIPKSLYVFDSWNGENLLNDGDKINSSHTFVAHFKYKALPPKTVIVPEKYNVETKDIIDNYQSYLDDNATFDYDKTLLNTDTPTFNGPGIAVPIKLITPTGLVTNVNRTVKIVENVIPQSDQLKP